MAVDISEPRGMRGVCSGRRAKAYGPVDVLVNNAALTYYIPVQDYPVNRWVRSWAVNSTRPSS